MLTVNQKFKTLLLLFLFVSCAESYGQTTIYSDDFNGAGGLLDGATEDQSATVWSASSVFLDDGNLTEADEGGAVLSFNPVINAIYELSLDIFNTTDRWVGLGFKDSALATPGGSDFADRFSNGGGRSWLLYRDHATDPTQDLQLFAGANVDNGIADNDVAIANFSQFNSLKVILNTTGDGSNYTVDYQLDTGAGFASISSGPQTVAADLSTLAFAGISYNNEEGITADIMVDNFLLTEEIIGIVPNEWTVDGGGVFAINANWSIGTPTAGSTVFFGGALSAANSPASVSLDSPASLAEVQFSNAGASYNLTGPSTLTLVGNATVTAASGTHEISAVITGNSGLTKIGGDTLLLSANNTFTGSTNADVGALRIRQLGAVDGAVVVAAGASFGFDGDSAGGGASGTFSNAISGAGEVLFSDTLTTETITFSNAKTYTGQTTINGGTLTLSSAGRPGAAGGTVASRTFLSGNETTGKLALASAAVTGELLTLAAREGAAIDSAHLTSSGNSSWSGNIRGDVGGTQYNIESTSGTLTLSGRIAAPDDGERNFVFSGTGNTNITGQLVDLETDEEGNPDELSPISNLSNVNVIKRGSGKLTINTATDSNDDYWHGTTTIEEGTLEVRSDGSNNGELRSSVQVRAGATFDVDHFGQYNLLPIAPFEAGLSGGGTVQVNTLGIFESATITPGDSVGTLTVNGAVSMTYFDSNEATVNNTGSFNYELGNDPTTVGGSENDLIAISGQLAINNSSIGASQWQINVIPAEGVLGTASNYTLIDAGSLSLSSANASHFQARIVDTQGNTLTTRQTTSVVLNAGAGNVELQVTGTAANQTWTGTSNSTWDKNNSTNWSGTGNTYFDLDNVTFPSGAANKNVVVNTSVAPGAINFNAGGSTYIVTGSGGLTGHGPVNINSGTVQLQNRGNSYAGATTIAGNARLETYSASTGSMNVTGALAVRSSAVGGIVDDFNTPGLSEYSFSKVLDQGTVTNVSFTDANGTLDVTSTGADGAEQVLLLRNDVTLQQGQELQLDAPTTFITRDLGIAIGEAHSDLGDGSTGDNRNSSDYLFMSWRTLADLNSRGFIGGAEVVLQQVFEANANKLFIARLPNDDIELGWYDGGTRNVSWTATPASTDIFNNIGFYGDLRADGDGFSGADNLVVISGNASEVLAIDGDLSLTGGTLEFDISSLGFTSADVTGLASLDGILAVNLLDGFMPTEGSEYDLLDANEGIFDNGLSFDLPSLDGGLLWDTSSFFDTGILSVVTLDVDVDNDGDVDGSDFLALQRDNPDLIPAWEEAYPGGLGGLEAASATVPEPTTALLLIIGLLGWANRQVRNTRRKES